MTRLFVLIVSLWVLAPPVWAETLWRVRASEGMDALLLLGAASGDVMQAEEYPDEIAWVRSHLADDELAALAALDQALRVEAQVLTGPTMVNFFSAADTHTLDAVIAAAEDPDRLLRPALEAAGDFDPEDYARARALLPHLATAARGLRRAGFPHWWRETQQTRLEAGVAAVLSAVQGHDVIGENQRFLARPLETELEIIVAAFCRPYGIRLRGQRFITHYSWDAGTQLRTAAHEIFHPPFDLEDWRILSRLEGWRRDRWLRSIVETHDPRFGYNSFEGVINEDSTQALDQIVAERLGMARDPRTRWREADGGMHMLAAALYHAMKEDGFDRRGGPYGDWLVSALDRGMLTPDQLRRRAALVAGSDAVAHWAPEIAASP